MGDRLQPGNVRQGVLSGHDGYLFLYDGGQHQFDYLVGDRQPTPESVAHLFDNLDLRQRFCAERGILYRHLVFPSKPVVATTRLPEPWRERVSSLFLSRYAATLTGGWPACLCYPRDLLIELDAGEPAFHALDTHLTDFGSRAVVHWLLAQIGIEPAPAEQFVETRYAASGDLARMLGSSTTVDTRRIRPLVPAQSFDNRDSLPSNTHNIAVLHNARISGSRRLLIFGDSFIKEALPFLAAVFSDVLYVRSSTFQADMVELFGPDVVITSNAERYLSQVESDRMTSPQLFLHAGPTPYTPKPGFRDALQAQLAWRHHRSLYDRWRRGLHSARFELGTLGLCQPNGDVEVVDAASGQFRSRGKDPFFLFPRTPLKPGRNYLLQLHLQSDVDSLATVYFQEGANAAFEESRTERLPVVTGDNELSFLLSSSLLGPALRLDPLTCPGSFTISSLSLIELPTAPAREAHA